LDQALDFQERCSVFSLPSLKIGRFFGIPLEVNVTWVVIFGLVAASLAFSTFPSEPAFSGWGTAGYVLAGVLTALAFFASIVVHELSHSVVARAGGVRIERVTLFMFGGVSQMSEEPKTPGAEFLMAIAGPAASLLLAGAFFIAEVASHAAGAPSWIWGPLGYLAQINLVVAAFNLLPGFPLDGGRVLRSIIWAVSHDLLKATRWAARTGQVIGYSMVALGLYGLLRGSFAFVWLGLIGWFIATLAEGAYRQKLAQTRLADVPVSAAMSPSPVTAPGEISLEQLAHDFFLGGRHTRYPVMLDGQVVGLVSLSRVKAIPRDRWPYTRVVDASLTDITALTIQADAPLESVLARLAGDTPGALLVAREGRLVGILTRADIISRIELNGPSVRR
jgi:Zn-dependent protease